MPDSTASETPHLRFVFMTLFVGFVITGMIATILGPILPVFIARWTLADAQAGLFFTTQFTGSFLGVLLSSYLLSVRGYRDTLVLGFLLMAAGVAGLNTSQHAALLATVTYGFGFGLAIPATNLCVAEICGPRRSAALNILNMAYSIGAIAGPLLMLMGLKANRFSGALYTIALGSFLFSILFWAMKFETQTTKPTDTIPRQAVASVHPIHVSVVLALLFYLYVGSESSVSGWAAEQAHRVGSGSVSTIVPMFFWAGLLSGRAISALILSHVKEKPLVLAGLLLSVLGTSFLLLATTRLQIVLGVVLAGFGFAGVYPIFISWLSKLYGERARRLGGVMFALAALGGATIPSAVGVVSQRSNSLRIGLLVPLAGCVAMLLLVAALRRRITA